MKRPQPFIFVAVFILCVTLMVVESGAVFK
jgi:hypothetical protein